jgi:hypothetical protein
VILAASRSRKPCALHIESRRASSSSAQMPARTRSVDRSDSYVSLPTRADRPPSREHDRGGAGGRAYSGRPRLLPRFHALLAALARPAVARPLDPPRGVSDRRAASLSRVQRPRLLTVHEPATCRFEARTGPAEKSVHVKLPASRAPRVGGLRARARTCPTRPVTDTLGRLERRRMRIAPMPASAACLLHTGSSLACDTRARGRDRPARDS